MTERDGAYTSVWQNIAAFTPQKFPHQRKFDVVIVGAGLTGIATALLLQKAGKKCLVLEAHTLGFGTTGGTTAHINTQLDTPYAVITRNFGLEHSRNVKRAVGEAFNLIRHQVEEYEIHCDYKMADAYLFAKNEKQNDTLKNIFKGSKEVGLDTNVTEMLPLNVPHEHVMVMPDNAKFHPLLYLQGLAREFEKAGGYILQETPLQETEHHGDHLTLRTTGDTFETNALVYATHIPLGINVLHLRCAPWRSYALAAELADGNYPTDLYYDLDDPYHYYRSQVVDGKNYLIVGGEDHKTGEVINTESCFLKLQAHVRNYFNVKDVAYQWSSQYYESADGLAYIGHLPGGGDNVYVATGFGGNGMIYSHVSAMVISNLILQHDSYVNDLFTPSRIKPVAGFTNFISHNANVAKHFIEKFINSETLDAFAGLAPNEGRVVSFEGEDLALFKSSEGKLYAVSPICPHMKCSVQWNQAEQSWDCPCHGARYAVNGRVLNGPSTTNLETVELRSLIEHH